MTHPTRYFLTRFFLFSTVSLMALLPVMVAAQQFEVPANDGFFTQTIDLVSADAEAELERILAAYRQASGHTIAMLAMQSMSGTSLSDVMGPVSERWRLNTESGADILVVATIGTGGDTAILAGNDLRQRIPEAVIDGVIDTEMTPRFLKADYAAGFSNAADALIRHISGEYAPNRYEEGWFSGFGSVVMAIIFVVLTYVMARLFHARYTWSGMVTGIVLGLFLLMLYAWWLAIPALLVLGLAFDFVAKLKSEESVRDFRP